MFAINHAATALLKRRYHDSVPWPGASWRGLGLGLYGGAPMLAFAAELGHGVLCWRIFRGAPGPLAVIVLGNLVGAFASQPRHHFVARRA